MPDIPALRRLTQSLAMLDAILQPEWEYRYYSFASRWGRWRGEEMASMRDGCGDDWFLLFSRHGAVLKGLAHESSLSHEGRLAPHIEALLPPVFARFVREPAFHLEWSTFCLWRQHDDLAWSVVPDPEASSSLKWDGSEELLRILDGNPSTYQAWAEEYYERDVSLPAVQAIYAHEALSAELVATLNEEATLKEVAADRAEIAYP